MQAVIGPLYTDVMSSPGLQPGQAYKVCPQCKTPAALDAPQCASCGRVYRTQFAKGAPPASQAVRPAPAAPTAPPVAALPHRRPAKTPAWFWGLCAGAVTLVVGGLIAVSIIAGRAEQKRLDALAPIWARKSDAEWLVEAGSIAGDMAKAMAYAERGTSRQLEVEVNPFLQERKGGVEVFLKVFEGGLVGQQVGFGKMELWLSPEPDGGKPYTWKVREEMIHIDPAPRGWRQ